MLFRSPPHATPPSSLPRGQVHPAPSTPPTLGPVPPAPAPSRLLPGALGSPASSPSGPTPSCLPAHCCFLSDLQVLFYFSKQRQLYSEQISSKIDSQQKENANQRRNASRLQVALHLGANGHTFPLGCGRHPEKAGRHGDASIAAAPRVEMTQTASELSSCFRGRFLPYKDLMAWCCEHPMLFSHLMMF